MPSKKWSFNATLFRKNLSRFWPLWGGASLLGALLPLILLMYLLNPYFIGDISAQDVTSALYMVVAGFLPVASLLYAVVAAMAVWSYLYTARSAGFIHTLPMNRETVFLTNLLSGLAIMLIPYAVTGALTCAELLCFGIFPPLAVVQTVGAVLGYTLFYFGSATFAAMVTSNTFAMPVFYFIGHFFAVMVQILLDWLAGALIFGYAGSDELSLTFLSPTVAFYRYMEVNSVRLDNGLWEIGIHGLWIVYAYAAVGLVLLLLSLLLYRLRHTESAGEVVAYRLLKPVFRYGVVLCSALTLGQMLYELLWNNAAYRLYARVVPLTGCMIFAGLLGYYAASMLLAKSHKVFRGSGRGAAVSAALVVLLCAGVYFDVLGLGRRIPDAADVQHVYLNIDGETLNAEAGDPRIEEIVALQRCLMDSEEEIRAYSTRGGFYGSGLYGGGRYGVSDEETTSVNLFYIDYTLRDGSTLSRRYQLPLRLSRWEGPADSYENRINRLMNAPETLLSQVEPPENGSLTHISIWAGENSIDTDGAVKDTIYAAILEDVHEGRYPGYRPFYDGEEAVMYLDIHMDLEFRYTWTNDQTGEQEVDYLYRSFAVSSSMTSTLQALLDAGVLSEEQALAQIPKEMLSQLTLPEGVEAVPALPDDGPPAGPADSFGAAVFVNP